MMAQQKAPNVHIFEDMQQQVRDRLQSCEPGQELAVLHNCLLPDHTSLWSKYTQVRNDLLWALQLYYPCVRVEIFGSTVMGTAFRDSDFDFFIQLSYVPLNAKPAEVIRKVKFILEQGKNFTNFEPIPNTRVPILKCNHIRTSMALDISFTSYGIWNSPIVAKLLTFDQRTSRTTRTYELSTILKFWGKVHDCIGKDRISNYALVWMLIFYLQQQEILPPIIEFQRRVKSFVIQSYNFAFDDRWNYQTTNRQRWSELLLGFFNFYKSFDFRTVVICPLHGKTFRKSEILAKKLPEFQRYHEILKLNPRLSPLTFGHRICIQDPFEITHSIPGFISIAVFEKITWKFEYAAELIESELKTNGESAKLLILLFDAEKCNSWLQQKKMKIESSSVQE